MNWTTFLISFGIGVAFAGAWVIGYYFGAKHMTEVGKRHLDEMHRDHLRHMERLFKSR